MFTSEVYLNVADHQGKMQAKKTHTKTESKPLGSEFLSPLHTTQGTNSPKKTRKKPKGRESTPKKEKKREVRKNALKTKEQGRMQRGTTYLGSTRTEDRGHN